MTEQNKNLLKLNKYKLLKTNKSANLKNFVSRIRKEPIYSSFKRKNLGSIPSKFDNFIFNLKKSKSDKYFKSNKNLTEENYLFPNNIFQKELDSINTIVKGNNIEYKGKYIKIFY